MRSGGAATPGLPLLRPDPAAPGVTNEAEDADRRLTIEGRRVQGRIDTLDRQLQEYDDSLQRTIGQDRIGTSSQEATERRLDLERRSLEYRQDRIERERQRLEYERRRDSSRTAPGLMPPPSPMFRLQSD